MSATGIRAQGGGGGGVGGGNRGEGVRGGALGVRRSPLPWVTTQHDLHLLGEEHAPRPPPSIRHPRRRSWSKPPLAQTFFRTNDSSSSSSTSSNPTLEHDLTFPSAPSSVLWESDTHLDMGGCGGYGGLGGSLPEDMGCPPTNPTPPTTRRQESVTYEESIPVIVRRRGCTLTVRIVSVEDVEVAAPLQGITTTTTTTTTTTPTTTSTTTTNAPTGLHNQRKSISTLCLPQVNDTPVLFFPFFRYFSSLVSPSSPFSSIYLPCCLL